MKKLLVIGAVVIGSVVSAFPFRTTCNIVFQISEESVKHMTPEKLTHTLKQLNYSACGTVPDRIVYYVSTSVN